MSKNSKNRHAQFFRSHAKLAEFWLSASEQHGPHARLALLLEQAEIVFQHIGGWELDARRNDYARRYRNFPLSKRCFVCAKTATQQHHVVLLSNGGENSYLNLVPICKPCHENVHPWMREDVDVARQNAAIERECASLDESYHAIVSPVLDVRLPEPDSMFTVTHAWLHGPACSGNGCGWTRDILTQLGVEWVRGKGPRKGWLSQTVGRRISFDEKAQIEKIAGRNKREVVALTKRMSVPL